MTGKSLTEVWLCDVCRRWFPTEQIRKVPHDALQMAGANYLNYSEYNASTWTLAGPAFLGPISMGTNGDFRLKVQESTTGTPSLFDATLLYAANTFEGPGLVSVSVPYGLDTTGWGSACFWVEMGPKEDEASEISVDVGLWSSGHLFSDPTYHVSYGSFTLSGHQTVWFSFNFADVPAALGITNGWGGFGDVRFYINVTCGASSKWWLQNAALSPNISFPGVFFPTSGSPVTYPVSIAYPPEATPAPGDQGLFPVFPPPPGGTIYLAATNQWTRMAVYACPSCADEVLLRRRTPGRRENRMIPPYEERET